MAKDFFLLLPTYQHSPTILDYMSNPKDTDNNTNNGINPSPPPSDDDSDRDTSQEGSSWRKDRIARSPGRSPKPTHEEQGRGSNRKGNAAKGRQSSPPGVQDQVVTKEDGTPFRRTKTLVNMRIDTGQPDTGMNKPK